MVADFKKSGKISINIIPVSYTHLQARKIEQKAKGASKKKSTERGGRLAHQKSMGSKEKKMHNAAKSLEHRIAALGNVEAPEDIRIKK